MKLFATCAFGLEKIVENELRKAKIWTISKKNGRVDFEGDWSTIYLSNLILRTADRVLINMGEFEAISFDQLFDQLSLIPWEEFFPQDAKILISATSSKSVLHGVPTIQSISQKAIFKRMEKKYKITNFPQTGGTWQVNIKMQNDICSVGINTSGYSLHRRGYRTIAGDAPLKETLAAAMILLSDLSKIETLIDPFCGSGTIPIEAALIDQNIAPGLGRNFAFQEWSDFDPKVFNQILEKLISEQKPGKLNIIGSDISRKMISFSEQNAQRAGLKNILWQVKSFNDHFWEDYPSTLLICNPPYGERLLEEEEANRFLESLAKISSENPALSLAIISPSENFASHFPSREIKNRKLYNGTIKCFLQQIAPQNNVKNL